MNFALDRLTAKVRAVNNANRVATEWQAKLVEIFRPFDGSKICNADGQFIKKIRDVLADMDLPSSVRMSVFRYISDYNVMYVAKACENINGETCLYHESVFYITGLKDGVMRGCYDPPVLRTDYDVCEIMDAHNKYKRLKLEADEVIAPFHQFELTR